MNSSNNSVRIVEAEISGLRINADGVWFYESTPLERLPLIRLFYSVMQQKGGKYYICTPVEHVEVAVDDTPYSVIRIEERNTNDSVNNNAEIQCILNDETSVSFNETCQAHIFSNNALYITLPNRFRARFTRSAYAEICRFLQVNDTGKYSFYLPSGGVVPIDSSALST